MFMGVFLALCFIVILYFLFMPVVLCIDTIKNQYYVHLKGLAKACIEGDKEKVLKISVKVLFCNFQFFPLTKHTMASKNKNSQKSKSKKNKKKFPISTVLRVLRSFKVKRFLLNIDTGHCIYNAKLYPIFALLNTKFSRFNINFDGKNQMVICLKNRPIYIIKSIINI